jgi:hypothetical protein
MSFSRLRYEVTEDRLQAGDYRVEAINESGDGEVFIAIFVGPDAQARAEEYADWKNSSGVLLERAS